MSKLLQRILSAAIFPAALMIVSKLIGMYLANRLFNLGWSITTESQGFFSVQVIYPDAQSAIMCNSYSNLFMLSMLLVGNLFLIFEAYFLHSSHQNPKVLVKLVQFDFVAWLTDSSSLFPKLAVWIAFFWTATIICIVQAIQLINYNWIAISAFVIAIVISWLAIRDFEQEIKTIIPEHGKLSMR